jgi:hypothetical protein
MGVYVQIFPGSNQKSRIGTGNMEDRELMNSVASE